MDSTGCLARVPVSCAVGGGGWGWSDLRRAQVVAQHVRLGKRKSHSPILKISNVKHFFPFPLYGAALTCHEGAAKRPAGPFFPPAEGLVPPALPAPLQLFFPADSLKKNVSPKLSALLHRQLFN